MGIPTWTPGEVLAAADVNSWFVPLCAVRTGDQSVTSSTTLVNDNTLVLAPATSATYVFEFYINWEGQSGTSNGIRCQWTVPSGATLRFNPIYADSSGNEQVSQTVTQSQIFGAEGAGAGTLLALTGRGTLVMSSTSGNLQFQWAQDTSNSTATIVHTQSYVMLRRVA